MLVGLIGCSASLEPTSAAQRGPGETPSQEPGRPPTDDGPVPEAADEAAAAVEPEGAAGPPASLVEGPRGARPRARGSLVVSLEGAASRTWCAAVAHIGDSTSTGTMNARLIPEPEERLDAQYRRVGVGQVVLENLGGRSLVEHRAGNENGVMVAARLREQGFAGCWVVALGTNDAANVARDPRIDHATRIARMMAVIDGEPVLWVDGISRKTGGYWAAANVEAWNRDLEQTLAQYPNARVLRWSALMRDDWWAKDDLHFNAAGYRARAKILADGLAAAFPAP